jgi:amidase
MAVQGPLTRTVRDARLAFAAMSAGSVHDPRWLDLPLDGPRPARPIRVAMVVDPAGRGGIQPEIVDAIHRAARALEAGGYAVEEIEPPEIGHVIDLLAG